MIALVLQALPTYPQPTAKAAEDNLVLQWNNAALEGVRQSKLGPPMVARALAIVHTCIFDAWAAYDNVAVGTRLGGSLRRPKEERTLPNKKKAISFAAYRATADLFPGQISISNSLMSRLGYNPSDASTDTATASGIGNVVCQAVLTSRHNDGSNQLKGYADTTGYAPVNTAMDLSRPLIRGQVKDVNHWQPLTYANASGQVATPSLTAPHWYLVTPFALSSGSQFRSPSGPVRYGSPEFEQQVNELTEISANLTDEQKAIAEYWADGPHSELPPGHWNLFAQVVSHRDRHSLDDDAKMFFALTNAIFDAGIVAWDAKRAFDSVRPITAVRFLKEGQRIRAWGGPGRGTQLIKGEDWLPYQPSFFPTPPFSEYSSGHSNFSAAGAEILKRFTGSDAFGHSVTIPKGSSLVEPGLVPASPITLTWATFSAAADQAGMSRRYGGIHFAKADLDARQTGRQVASQAWVKAQSYINP